ncbi:MAG: hypothetical protein EKK53_11765 [Burkholderiales bacterium]|nr:MAG: hypothetical protein EKK53_11765 [Burkholderiales bacterium]
MKKFELRFFRTSFIVVVLLALCGVLAGLLLGVINDTTPKLLHDDPHAVLKYSAEKCKLVGGEVSAVCGTRTQKCIVEYPDAGKACDDSSQCLGGCYLDLEKLCLSRGAGCFGQEGPPKVGDKANGTCKPDNNPCGNFWKVDNGKISSAANID